MTHKRKKIFREFWNLNYTNTNLELRKQFESDMLIAFNRKVSKMGTGIDLKANSTKNIIRRLNLFGKNSYNWFIPKEVFDANLKIKSAWCQAFFDDESTVSIQNKAIKLKIVNHKGLIQIQALLNDLGIESNITGPNIDKTWILNIRHENIKRFSNLVGFVHPEKIKKLKILAGKSPLSHK